ncbi:MAG: hypothetical protein BMS9Abin02_0413 [Anaerolineae bacterium]|nr:MAG: hypothetical protein BMS9Abin02_0413 [Anaerolineae bacterium]
MIVGMDFGTTNSGMALHDGEEVKLLPLDPTNLNPTIARTALYITNDHDITIGRAAIDRYFDHNAGRPVKLKKVWVGEVEVYGADMYYVTDVFAWVDILSPGRLFLSIKSGLSDAEYQGTMVGRFYYSLEKLIASYLSLTKIRAERQLDREISGVVLGRPVRFSEDPAADKLAEARLLEAARLAGYQDIFLQYEPIAAAYYYASTINEPQNIMVFDFGGGTVDITVMHLRNEGEHQVLATGGLPAAGDVFDRKVVRAKLPKHFGEGTRYGSPDRCLPLPAWIYELFSNWQTIIELQSPANRQILNEIAQTAEDKSGIEGLISLVANNYSLKMFDTIETAKRQLSNKMATVIRLEGPGFHVAEPLSRGEFEQIIHAETQKIADHIDDTVQAAGLSHAQIDAVIRTGGSSEIPVFKSMLISKFGRGKVHKINTFSSVASGLGIMAHGIASGAIRAEPRRSDITSLGLKSETDSDVVPINLDLLKLRMAASEIKEGTASRPVQGGLIILSTGGQIKVMPWKSTGEESGIVPFKQPPNFGIHQAMLISLDQALLLVTNRYRFLLTTPQRISELSQVGMSLGEFYQLKDEEVVSAIAPWNLIRDCLRIILATGQGFVRSYALAQMVENIESPASLIFDQPLPGSPKAVMGSNGDDYLLTFSDKGRASRMQTGRLRLQGQHIIKLGKGERLTSAITARPGDEVLLMTASGFGRRLPVEWIPESLDGKATGRSMISRTDLRAVELIKGSRTIWILTDTTILALDPDVIPEDREGVKKSYLLVEVKAGQQVIGLVSDFQDVD